MDNTDVKIGWPTPGHQLCGRKSDQICFGNCHKYVCRLASTITTATFSPATGANEVSQHVFTMTHHRGCESLSLKVLESFATAGYKGVPSETQTMMKKYAREE